MTRWSKQQEAIFSWFRNGQGNLVVRARAGSGKTTTVIEGISYAPEERILLAAFNRKIADELGARLQHPGAEAATLHSLGFRFIRERHRGIRVDKRRSFAIAKKACPGDPEDLLKDVIKLSSILKSVEPMIGSGRKIENSDVILAMRTADTFAIRLDDEWEKEGFNAAWLATSAIKMLRVGANLDDGTVDFDDMFWVPVRNRWVRPIYDLVIADECQDLSRTQTNLAIMVCKKGGRIAVIGDDKQSIYGFRGADSTSLDRLKKALRATEMGLTTTYRCGKNIVREARRLVPDFHAFEGNPDGVVRTTNIGIAMTEADVGDFILSRTNAPLVSCCLKLLRDGKRANIEGRDVGGGLKAIIRKVNKGPARKSFKAFNERLASWYKVETKKAEARGEKGLATLERLYDQYETICSLMEGLASADEIIDRIESLFEDTEENKGLKIILSSVHRSKGLEAKKVWLLKDTFFTKKEGQPPPWVDISEERNIEYVAITRAIDVLTWVEGKL